MPSSHDDGEPLFVATALAASPRPAGGQEQSLVETIFDHTQIMIALLDVDMRFVKVNHAYAKADGKTPEYFQGKGHFDLYPHEDNERIFRRTAVTGEPYYALAKPFQYSRNPERGTTYWDWSLVPVRNEKGEPIAVLLSLLDVSQRIRAMEELERQEQMLRATLAEKEVLIREVHHRVKNNLQIVSSMLSMQTARASSPEVHQALGGAQGRILAIAQVHEHLDRLGSLARVDFEEYLRGLVTGISDALGAATRGVEIAIDVQSSALSIDVAVPLGLIVHELVSNALIHAFPANGSSNGKIQLSLRASDSNISLQIADDGVQPPNGASSLRRTPGLGLQLVRALASQLGGELIIDGHPDGSPGTRVSMHTKSDVDVPSA